MNDTPKLIGRELVTHMLETFLRNGWEVSEKTIHLKKSPTDVINVMVNRGAWKVSLMIEHPDNPTILGRFLVLSHSVLERLYFLPHELWQQVAAASNTQLYDLMSALDAAYRVIKHPLPPELPPVNEIIEGLVDKGLVDPDEELPEVCPWVMSRRGWNVLRMVVQPYDEHYYRRPPKWSDLLEIDDDKILDLRNVGPITLSEIKKALYRVLQG